jgi:hypothetical protein
MTRQVALVGSPQDLHSRGEIGGARRSAPRRSLSRGSKTADPSPLVGAKRPLIRFKTSRVPAKSVQEAPRRPWYDCAVKPRTLEGRSTQASLAAVDRALRASHRRERAWSAAGRDTRLVRLLRAQQRRREKCSHRRGACAQIAGTGRTCRCLKCGGYIGCSRNIGRAKVFIGDLAANIGAATVSARRRRSTTRGTRNYGPIRIRAPAAR